MKRGEQLGADNFEWGSPPENYWNLTPTWCFQSQKLRETRLDFFTGRPIYDRRFHEPAGISTFIKLMGSPMKICFGPGGPVEFPEQLGQGCCAIHLGSQTGQRVVALFSPKSFPCILLKACTFGQEHPKEWICERFLRFFVCLFHGNLRGTATLPQEIRP